MIESEQDICPVLEEKSMTDLLTCLNGLDAAALYCPAGAPLLSM